MLIKLPKEVGKIMNRLAEAGFEAYVVGGCVRDSLVGRKPYDWDLTTNARIADLKAIFPEARVLSEKFSVIRLEYLEDLLDEDGEVVGETGIIADVATYRRDGEYKNGRPVSVTFVESVAEDLPRRDFTVNAIADSYTDFVDPFNGREDMRQKLIRAVGDPDARFKEDPSRILRALRIAAEMGFDLHKSVYEAAVANRALLEDLPPAKLRDEFTKLLSAEYAGKGLKMLLDMDFLPAIIGHNAADHLTKREKQDLMELCAGIDRSQRVEERRLGLFFACIGKNKIKPAIARLEFDEDTHQKLVDAVTDLPKLYFTATKPTLKKFIYQRGWDRYNYLANLEKAQRIVFGYDSETKIKSKMFMIQDMAGKGEAIFVEDLVVDADDLLEAGICTEDKVENVLRMMIEEVHTHPLKNNRNDLMKLAKLYSKNPLARGLRGIHWSR